MPSNLLKGTSNFGRTFYTQLKAGGKQLSLPAASTPVTCSAYSLTLKM
jgi:hypothetical protein